MNRGPLKDVGAAIKNIPLLHDYNFLKYRKDFQCTINLS